MNKIISEIRALEKQEDNDGLGSYLVNLAKHGDNPIQYESEFSKHFISSDWVLRKAAVFCILYALKIDKPEYRDKAIEFVLNPIEDEDVRIWAASGLSVTYQESKDRGILSTLLCIIDNPEEEQSMKSSLLRSALQVYGLSAREQLFRSNKILPSFEKMLCLFESEIIDIRKIIN